MPELPEVETVRRGLLSLEGKVIEQVTLRRADLRVPFPENLAEIIEGVRVASLDRRAKYLLMHLENGQTLILHLGMSGKLLLHAAMPNALAKHDHVVMRFTDGATLIFNDARRFGFLLMQPTEDLDQHPSIAPLGPEPLSEDLTVEYLYGTLKKKSCSMKAALMDQRVVAGLGNIYVCESLFMAGILPDKKANKVTKKAVEKLVPAIKQVLEAAIASGGSTLRDYVRSSGDLGYFQHEFKVYGREGESCTRCGATVKRIIQQNRSTFYCGSCQS